MSTATGVDLSRWRTLGSTNNVRHLSEAGGGAGGDVWALTEGGVVVIDTADLSVSFLTNVDGLQTNDLEYTITDSRGDIWLCGMGWLVQNDAATGHFTPFLFRDQNDNSVRLYYIADDNDQLWIGTSIGLSLFSKDIDGGEIRETFTRFGPFPDNSEVLGIVITGDSIMIVTPSGLARAKRTDPTLLKLASSWITTPTLFGATAIVNYKDTIFIGTTAGADKLVSSGGADSLISLGLLSGSVVNQFLVDNDTLRMFTSIAEYKYNSSGLTQITNPGLPNQLLESGYEIGSLKFRGLTSGGIYVSSAGGSFTAIETGAIPGSFVSDIEVITPGKVYGAFNQDGFAELINGVWTPLGLSWRDGAISVSRDSAGAIWFGTFGNGVWRRNGPGAIRYDSLNSSLKGNDDGGPNNYVVVPEIVSGPRYTYFATFRAFDTNAISIVDQLDRSRWTSIGKDEGVTDEFIVSIDLHDNFLAAGSSRQGVFLITLGGDPFNAPVLQTTHYNSSKPPVSMEFLREDIVNVVRFDNEGNLWVGHRSGISRLDPGIERFVDIELPLGLGPEVLDIVFDPTGTVWFATPSGLGSYTLRNNSFEVFTTLNSGLVSDQVQSLDFDRFSNELWIGTENGISIYRPNIGQPILEISQVTAYPNPFVVNSAADRMYFNFSGVVEARIFAESGELVWVGQTNQGWAGVNQSGRKVASGVYIFLVTDSEGDVGRGKILLLHNR
ncbi:MAG: hypothetical protein IIB00_04895 [candidate division Zixibacteria bacterium]|nr:hypothetical protein [candidate division Zixibacteria bacterium]